MDRTGGVLTFNNEIRNAHLLKNLGQYSQYTEELHPAIGEYYEIYTRPLVSITKGKSLIDYTHDGKSDYSTNINHNYLNDDIAGHHVYTNDRPVFGNTWSGDYNNYLNYVMAVYGHEHVPIQFINGLLSLNFMDKALELIEPGIVRDIAPVASLAGAVKTNINNFSGTDTKLGLITNQMYAKSLLIGATFNSDRQRTQSYKESLITPSLLTKYGNTESNLNALPNLILPNHSDGRVVEEYNADVYIFDEFNDIVNLNTTRIADALRKNVNQPFVKLDNTVSTNTYYNPLDEDKNDVYVKYTDKKIDTSMGRYVNVEDLDTKEFEDSDSRPTENGIMEHAIYQDNGHEVIMGDAHKFDQYRSISEDVNKKSLLFKTNEIFKEHKIHTIYGEHAVNLPFGMGHFVNSRDTETTTTDTSKTDKGRSRGRNLKKKNPTGDINGYDNPFCRVWTYHNQYDRVIKLIRPFADKDDNAMDLSEVQNMNIHHRSFIKAGSIDKRYKDGGQYLADNTVLRKTGFVNITPSSTDQKNDKVDISKCMFSIENLAWKDVPDRIENLSKEQRGPHGGRIMWFPPYDINFSENVNANWDSNTFIGRGEKVYTYTNTDRTGSLSFTLLIDHPAVLNDLHNEAGNPNIPDYDGDGEIDKVEDMENDILRFFAGCAPLKYIKKPESERKPEPEPEPEPEPKLETIKIYVFYPNNYSGHLNEKPKDDGEDKNGDADDDFAIYLIRGRNADLKSEKGEFIGYEMGKNGISIESNDGVIPACKSPNAHEDCSTDYDGSDAEERYFHYRVDYDLRQNHLLTGNTSSYVDSQSFGLNLNVDNVKKDGKKEDASYSFAEFYYAIENLKKVNGLGYDKDGMEYIEELLGNSGKPRLDAITNIFIKDCEIDNVTINGGATSQDRKNSNMLAYRRAGALKWYINEACKNNIKGDIKIGTIDVPEINGYSAKSINEVKPKSERYAVIELSYKVSDTQKLSETDADKTQDEKTVEHAKAMKLLYETMLESSDILTRYNNSGNASEENFVTWFNGDDNTHKETFSDDYILENDITENTEFYTIIYDYCQSVYICQNFTAFTSTGVIGYSRNINLSDSIALKENKINEDFEDKIAYINDLGDIEEILDRIESDNTAIKEAQTHVESVEKSINDKIKEIKDETNKLGSLTEGSDEYINKVGKIQTLISAKNDLLKNNLPAAERALKEAQAQKDEDEKAKERLKNAKSKIDDKEIVKLRKEIDELTKKIKKIDDKISDKQAKITEADEKLEEYIAKAKSGQRNQTTNINYWKNQISKLYNDKNVLLEERQGYVDEQNKKNNQMLELERGKKELFDNLHIPSVGNLMYLMDKILSDGNFESLYEHVLNDEDTGEFIKAFFESSKNRYEVEINNLSSGFEEEGEDPTHETKYISFWPMYAIYLLTKWIETDICKIDGDKTSDDLVELFKYAVDEAIKRPISYYITFLVTKYRINNQPTDKFKIDGITDVAPYLVEMDTYIVNNDLLKNTYAFVHSDETPTQELASAAVEEINTILTSNAEKISRDAKQAKQAADSEKNGPKTTVTVNNGEPEETIENSAANTVLVLNNIKDEYHNNGHRYETESEYFSKLKDKDPIIFKYIKDKIKYFDPAFHSMSPEGFNARLTFLQQCTRQGHTIEAQTSGDERAATAGNLAFGRMPICILRIGDFIYSRIIINSISINYENNGGIQWDLNPEGAGVQPMMAKVSMAITILGGQSLEGPISRLQNAVSFNYYANAGVYDNRADRSRPAPTNDQAKANGTQAQTVEGNEASAQTGNSTQSNSTNDKYKTQNYYVWSPVNEEGKSMRGEKNVENNE